MLYHSGDVEGHFHLIFYMHVIITKILNIDEMKTKIMV